MEQGSLRDRYVRGESPTHLRCPDRTAAPHATSPRAMPVRKAGWEGRPAAEEGRRDDGWTCPRGSLRVYTQESSTRLERRGEKPRRRCEEGVEGFGGGSVGRRSESPKWVRGERVSE